MKRRRARVVPTAVAARTRARRINWPAVLGIAFEAINTIVKAQEAVAAAVAAAAPPPRAHAIYHLTVPRSGFIVRAKSRLEAVLVKNVED